MPVAVVVIVSWRGGGGQRKIQELTHPPCTLMTLNFVAKGGTNEFSANVGGVTHWVDIGNHHFLFFGGKKTLDPPQCPR